MSLAGHRRQELHQNPKTRCKTIVCEREKRKNKAAGKIKNSPRPNYPKIPK
ncbi:hypothetical protein Scep_026089 [Stephania cephalantha]|uniref:Uncharacterized protein n=1 Tax=Stephania cephalantha TaxID=152367 RepID=A0AAP0HT10_9MAGN